MDQDEKTERGHRGPPVVRSTAPVGTPYPVVADPPLAAPTSSRSQPRTVGGNSGGKSVRPMPEDEDDTANTEGSLVPPPSSVGGTARIDLPSPEEAAAAQAAIARMEAEDAVEKAAQAMVSLVETPAPPPPPPPMPLGLGDDPYTSPLFAPLSVGVGLIFFAMGSMLTVTINGYIGTVAARARASAAVSTPMSSAARPAAPSSSPTASVSAGTGAVGASGSLSSAPVASGKALGSSGPAVKPLGSKRPPLPF